MIKTKIISNPKILRGKPVIAGTRISVELIMDLFAAGLSVDKILENYPHLSREAVLVAVRFARDIMLKEEIYPIVEKNGQVVFLNA